MRRNKRYRWIGAALLYFLVLCIPLSARASDNQIEQVYVNKPEVTVYFRAETGQENVRAYLDGEELTLGDCQKFSETEQPVNYFVLTDISGSINASRFEDIKSSLIAFLQEMRPEDRLLLNSFGDKVTQVLNGDEDRNTAVQKISEMINEDSNTLLFEAIEQAADIISRTENEKWVLIIISDGEDYADNTQTADSTTDRLIELGIPAYTIAVENDMGYSEQVIGQYQSNFSAVAVSTGGIAWTPGREDTLSHSIKEALDGIKGSVMDGYRASFYSSNNQTSNQREQFVLTFTDGSTSVRDVLVSRSQPDTEAPSIFVEENTENSFRVMYSEAVEGAELPSNYLITQDGRTVGVEQIVKDGSGGYTYLLFVKEKLKNSVYHITVSNVTDVSNERNSLTGNELDVTVTGMQERDTTPPQVEQVEQSGAEGFLVTFSESVLNGDNNGNYVVMRENETVAVQQVVLENEKEHTYRLLLSDGLKNGDYTVRIGGTITDASEEMNALKETEKTVTINDRGITLRTILNFFLRWWPIALTVVVIILLIIVLLFNRRIRKKNVVVLDDKIVEVEKLKQVVHVSGVKEEKKGREKKIVLWLSNGKNRPERIDYTIQGSCFVGRSGKLCEIYCDDPMMSKQHFNLSVEADGNVYVTDAGSTNGTAVNGIQIKKTRKLNSGDEITAGNIRFVIEW